MHRGYAKLFRKVTEWALFTDPACVQMLCWVLVNVTREKRRVNCKGVWIDLEPGDCYTTQQSLQASLGRSRMQIRNSLSKLIEDGTILTNQVSNRVTVISLVNWEVYMDWKSDGNQPGNQPATNRQPTGNQPVTNPSKQEVKSIRGREVKEVKHPAGASGAELLKLIWNKHTDKHPVLAKVRSLSDKRKVKCKTRLSNPDYLDLFNEAISKIPHSSSGLMWQPDFDWLIENDTNILKVVEGRYEAKSTPTSPRDTRPELPPL